MILLKIFYISFFILLSLYHYFSSEAKKLIPDNLRRNTIIVWYKVKELSEEGNKKAKWAMFFYNLLFINAALIFAISLIIIF